MSPAPQQVLRTIAVVVLPCLVPPSAEGQPFPAPGTRVRVEEHSRFRVDGTVVRTSGDTLFVQEQRRYLRAIPADAITRVDTSAGRYPDFWRHFTIVWWGSVGIGTVASAIAYEPCEKPGFMACLTAPESRGEAAFRGALVGAVIGIPAGGIAGGVLRSERWSPVEGWGSRVSLRPLRGGGIGIGATLTIPTR